MVRTLTQTGWVLAPAATRVRAGLATRSGVPSRGARRRATFPPLATRPSGESSP